MTNPANAEYDTTDADNAVRSGGDMRRKNVDQWGDAVDGWLDWLRAAGRSEQTIRLRRYQIGRFFNEVVDKEHNLHLSPWKVTTQILVDWTSSKDWSANTRRTYRDMFQTFYAWAKLTGRVKKNPADQLPRIRATKGRPKPTPDDILDAALEQADDRTRLIIMLAAYAGLRRAEIANMRWDWIIGDTLRVHGKGDKTRVIPVHPKLRSLLTVEHARRLDGRRGTGFPWQRNAEFFVFPGQGGGASDPAVIGRLATKALGGLGWTAHTLRHRFATRAYALGGRDLLAVQELLGHESPETTRVYTQVPEGAMTDAVAAI